MTPKAKQKLLVYKSMHYKTILEVKEEHIINKIIHEKDFKISELPNRLTLILENNEAIEVEGVWELTERMDYKFVKFIILCNPNYEDVFGKLKFMMEV